MRKFKYIARTIVWTVIGLYVIFIGALHLPSVQEYLGGQVAQALQDKLGTKVTVGRVDVGLFNRLTIDSVTIEDQQHKKMLQIGRLAANIDIKKLIRTGSIDISSAQLFGMNANLYKANEKAKPNFQFALDSLASKDEEPAPLDLTIRSLVIRQGRVAYNQLDAPRKTTIDPNHLAISNLSAHLILDKLTDDSVALKVKELSLKERSGLDIRSLTGKVYAGKKAAQLHDFKLRLPNSELTMGDNEIVFAKSKGKEQASINHFTINIAPSSISPRDLSFLDKGLEHSEETLNIQANMHGSSNAVVVDNVKVSDPKGRIDILANGQVTDINGTPNWKLNATNITMSANGIQYITQHLKKQHVNLPEELGRLGNIRFQGNAQGHGDYVGAKGKLASDAGKVVFDAAIKGKQFKGKLLTDGINIGRILQDKSIGILSANIDAEGSIAEKETPLPFHRLATKGKIQRLDYNNYSYKNITVDGVYQARTFNGKLAMDDPNGKIDIEGLVSFASKNTEAKVSAHVDHLNPQALRLTSALGDYTYTLDADTHINGSNIGNMVGFVNIDNFNMYNKDDNVSFENLNVKTGYEDGDHTVDLQSDFGSIYMKGKYDYKTISNSVINLIASKIPTMPQLPKNRRQTHNDLTFVANINDMNWFQQIMDIPLKTQKPIHINGKIDDDAQKADLNVNAPEFAYAGMEFLDCNMDITTEGDTLYAVVKGKKKQDEGSPILLDITAKAANNNLISHIFCDTQSETQLKGDLYAETNFYTSDDGHRTAHIRIHPSEIMVDQSQWHVQPSDIIFTNNQLYVDYFQINNNNQHINISGKATSNPNDSLVVDLNNIDVGYVLDLVNFHSVEFSGYATGKATVKDLFGTPDARVHLTVNEFPNYDNGDEQININAHTDDEPYTLGDGTGKKLTGDTYITGFVSPKRKDLDIRIVTDGARAEFLENFCGSFMDNVTARARGYCRVFGTFKNVNLEGNLVADGLLDITTLNTTYTLRHDTVTLVPDHIIFPNDTVFDRDGHRAVVSGGLKHTSLKNLTYDIDVNANNFLAYDFHDYGANSFYGTVYGTGLCNINGKKGEVNFNVDCTPNRGSFIEYNAAHPNNVNKAEFIQWHDKAEQMVMKEAPAPVSNTDVHINIHSNYTQDFTLRILMDENTGDKITLVGGGDLRATYFNKGAFDMYGTYAIDHGTYIMTIQNVIKKLFTFQNGSTMTFGGDPFGAALNLKAQYIIPAVSLADLQMGRSFTQNNIKVNCLMNIGGTAGEPRVTFDLDLPTLSADAKQMVMSVINSQEDLNQQVLYLLAVGRFMPQRNNNAAEENTQQSQTSLAMQSILSGTITQQLNNVLTSVLKVPNWNFGAHISTGNEGFSNAEYEGLLSGRLLNNRLLINGEFGYRDNVATQQSNFIGDFDVQYLLKPNGNLAVKVYNQTNDRYFTRNSLNTQGVGLIIKKDFNNLRELFGKKKNKKVKKEKKVKKNKKEKKTKE